MGPISSLQVAWSAHSSLSRAVSDIVQTAMRSSRDPVLALVFSAGDWDREALARALGAELGRLPWCGCTATAVFAGRKLMTNGIAIGVLNAPQASVGIGLSAPLGVNPLVAGETAVARAIDHLPPLAPKGESGLPNRTILLFADTFNGNGTDTVRGAIREGGTAVCWGGGGVGGQKRATGRMSLMANGRAFLDRAVALAIDLPVSPGSGMGHGFYPQGPSLTVTHTMGNLVNQLEYSPARDTFEKLVRHYGGWVGDTEGDLSELCVRYPFGIPQADGSYLLREFVEASEADGMLEFVSALPEGSIVRLMQCTPSSLIEGARAAAFEARSRLRAPPSGALIFDCDGRLLTLGSDFQREIDAISDALGADVPILGCTSYGEVGALGAGFPQFHNKTVHVLALPGEEPRS